MSKQHPQALSEIQSSILQFADKNPSRGKRSDLKTKQNPQTSGSYQNSKTQNDMRIIPTFINTSTTQREPRIVQSKQLSIEVLENVSIQLTNDDENFSHLKTKRNPQHPIQRQSIYAWRKQLYAV